jgi:hypothetical protein
MAVTHNHYAFNPGTVSGSRLRNALNLFEQGRQYLINELATLTADLEGDGSLDAHFSKVTERYGFQDTSYARAAWLELSSALAKVTTDSSVSSVQSALVQLFTRLR